MQLRVDGGQRRNINDGVPARVLPHARPYIHGRERRRACEKPELLKTHFVEEHVDQAVALVEEQVQDAYKNHHRNKMRRVRNGLHGFFQLWAFHLVEYQRQQNREWERHYKVIQAQPYRISQQPPEIIGIKETVQVLHSRPRATPDAQPGRVVLEGDLHAVHRQITKNNEIDDRRDQKQVKALTLVELCEHPPAPRARFSARVRAGAAVRPPCSILTIFSPSVLWICVHSTTQNTILPCAKIDIRRNICPDTPLILVFIVKYSYNIFTTEEKTAKFYNWR